MCKCEQKRLAGLIKLGDDLVAAIEKANWGTISHPTMHMLDAVAVWKEKTSVLQSKGLSS